MSTARYSLNVYDPDTYEVTETLEANGLLWGQLVEIFEMLSKKGASETELFEDVMLAIFKKATRDKLKLVMFEDMVSIVMQIKALGAKNGLVQSKAKN